MISTSARAVVSASAARRSGRSTFVARGLLRRGVIGADAEAAGYLPKVRALHPYLHQRFAF